MIGLYAWAKFHMSHALARTLEQTVGVIEQSTEEESNVDVRHEGVDVAKRRVPDTRCRVSIVKQLSHIIAKAAHKIEPWSAESGELGRARVEPLVHGRVVSYGGFKAHQLKRRF